ncbi:MAG: hypothetical protein ACR2PO_09460 [Methyloligellaceae bacterium]
MARVAWRRLLPEQFRGLTDHKSGSSYGEFGNDTISGGAGWDYPIFSHLDFGESDVVIHTSDLDTVTLHNTQMGDLIQADFKF